MSFGGGHPIVKALAGIYWLVALLVIVAFAVPSLGLWQYAISGMLWIGYGVLVYGGIIGAIILAIFGLLLWRMSPVGWWAVTIMMVINFCVAIFIGLTNMNTDQWISAAVSFTVFLLMLTLKNKFRKKKRF